MSVSIRTKRPAWAVTLSITTVYQRIGVGAKRKSRGPGVLPGLPDFRSQRSEHFGCIRLHPGARTKRLAHVDNCVVVVNPLHRSDLPVRQPDFHLEGEGFEQLPALIFLSVRLKDGDVVALGVGTVCSDVQSRSAVVNPTFCNSPTRHCFIPLFKQRGLLHKNVRLGSYFLFFSASRSSSILRTSVVRRSSVSSFDCTRASSSFSSSLISSMSSLISSISS